MSFIIGDPSTMTAAFPLLCLFHLCNAAVASTVCDATAAMSVPWAHAGPGGYRNGNVPGKFDEGIASAGAAQAMVQLGGINSTEWLLATANGGIWRTTDLLAAKGPHWVQVLDGQPVTCTSISAMEGRGATVLAGCGSATSSEMGFDWMAFNSGDWGGLMISRDSGHTWTMTTFPSNLFITAIVLLDNSTFLVSARASFHDRDAGGVWWTGDGGATWTRTLNKPVYDLVAVPAGRADSDDIVLAAVPWTTASASVLVSHTGGADASGWSTFAEGLTWDARTPFYPTFAVGQDFLFVGALTVNPAKLSDTASCLYSRPLADLRRSSEAARRAANGLPVRGYEAGAWLRLPNEPYRLDRDGMPKDRST